MTFSDGPVKRDQIRGEAHLKGTSMVKRGLATQLRGGVIMDVVTPEQAMIAEDAGADCGDGPGAGAR